MPALQVMGVPTLPVAKIWLYGPYVLPSTEAADAGIAAPVSNATGERNDNQKPEHPWMCLLPGDGRFGARRTVVRLLEGVGGHGLASLLFLCGARMCLLPSGGVQESSN